MEWTEGMQDMGPSLINCSVPTGAHYNGWAFSWKHQNTACLILVMAKATYADDCLQTNRFYGALGALLKY